MIRLTNRQAMDQKICSRLSKEMLGLVRSKFATLPIGHCVTLNGSDLVGQGKETNALRETKSNIGRSAYTKMSEQEATIVDNLKRFYKIPYSVYVGITDERQQMEST